MRIVEHFQKKNSKSSSRGSQPFHGVPLRVLLVSQKHKNSLKTTINLQCLIITVPSNISRTIPLVICGPQVKYHCLYIH